MVLNIVGPELPASHGSRAAKDKTGAQLTLDKPTQQSFPLFIKHLPDFLAAAEGCDKARRAFK
jgi:hypothetical protein